MDRADRKPVANSRVAARQERVASAARRARSAGAAEDHFPQALDWARRQGPSSWELRAATSLARLWHYQTRTKEAEALLSSVYSLFTEGVETVDLKMAHALLDQFRLTRRSYKEPRLATSRAV